MTVGIALAALFAIGLAAKTIWVVYGFVVKRDRTDTAASYVSGWGTAGDPSDSQDS